MPIDSITYSEISNYLSFSLKLDVWTKNYKTSTELIPRLSLCMLIRL